MSSENFLLARLSQNFETLLQISNNNHDVIINVGDELNSKTFYAHSLILTSQSTYFKTALSSNWIKKDEDKIIFEKPNVSSKIFETILKHLYCGVVNLNEFTPLELLDLISSADEFMLPELMSFTESHLLSLADSWMNTDFVKVHLHAQKFSECKNLREFCVKKICKNPEIIFESNDFINLSEVMLIDLLKKDDLEMDEIELWKYVVQWGIHKCSTNLNGKNVNEWNDENFKELWEIIKNLVELIRFYDISIENFYNMVKPYSSMFPRDMFENLLWNYIMPQSNKHSRRKRLGFGPTTNARPFGQTTTVSSFPSSGGVGFGRQTTTTTAPSSGFGFGQATTAPPSGSGFDQTTTVSSFPSSGGVGFGRQTTTTTAPSSGFGFGQATTAPPSGSGFDQTTTVSSFPSSGGFGFGRQTTTTTAPSSGFGFGQATTAPPSGSGFDQTTTVSSFPSSGGFGFGRQTTTTTAPSSGFGFGQATTAPPSGSGFDQTTTVSSFPSSGGFGFGRQTTTTTAPSSGFGFGQATTAPPSGSGFDQTTTVSSFPSSGGFGFGRQTTTTTAPSSGFGFGQATTAPPSGSGFDQTTTVSSFPSSGGFGFGRQTTTTTAPSSGFGFGQIIIPDLPEEEDDDI